MEPGAVNLGAEPGHWYVVFDHRCATDWLQRLVPGRFKHVSAFGQIGRTGVWVFVNPLFGRLSVSVAQGEAANNAMAVALDGDRNPVIQMPAPEGERPIIRPLFSCVSVIAHLVGVRSCALRPDGLWRDCLAQGGRIVGAEPGQACEEQRSEAHC